MANTTFFGSVAVDFMHKLRGGFTGCKELPDGRLDVCQYHRDRCNCRIIGITDGGGADTVSLDKDCSQMQLRHTPQIEMLFKRMASGKSVAGGWYLVQQQRVWLENHVTAILRDKQDADCRIMVAGIAGYAHFFSYMKILIDAAHRAQFDVAKLHIDVVDQCPTPLYEIMGLLNDRRLLRRWIPQPIPLNGITIKSSLNNQRFIRAFDDDLFQCHIRPICASVDDLPENCGKYDIITEHFLTSMMEKAIPQINASRASYAKVMNKSGHLLMASGFPKKAFIDELLQLHSQHGFTCKKSDIQKVWDPYGLSQGTLITILSNPHETYYVPLDNILADFTFCRTS